MRRRENQRWARGGSKQSLGWDPVPGKGASNQSRVAGNQLRQRTGTKTGQQGDRVKGKTESEVD